MGEVEQNTFTEQMEHGKMKWLFFEFMAKKNQKNKQQKTNQPTHKR